MLPKSPVLLLLAFAACFSTLIGCQPARAPLPEGSVLLFARPALEPIYLEDLPLAEELDRTIHLAATPGEYESASLGVHARIDLPQAQMKPTDLTGPADARIPATAMDVKITRYIEPFPRWPKIKKHSLAPGFLDPKPAVEIAANSSQQFWLTVRVPEQTPAGLYRGSVEFTADGQAALQLPVELEVYPFQLDEAGPGYFLAGNNFPLEEHNLANARAHGMNTILVNHGWAKQIVPRVDGDRLVYPDEFTKLREIISLAQKHGLSTDRPIGLGFYSHLTQSVPAAFYQAKIPGPGGELVRELDYRLGYEHLHRPGSSLEKIERHPGTYYPSADPYAEPDTPYGRRVSQGWVDAFQAFETFAEREDWPPLWYYIIDEPHHSRGSMRLAIQMLRAADQAGAVALITANEPSLSEPKDKNLWFPPLSPEPGLRLKPWPGIRCYHNKYLGQETLARTRQAGGLYSTYINVYGNQPLSSRHLAGFLAWRLELDTVMVWQWKMVSTEFGQTRSYLRDWEAVREGIDDLRYLERLERALEQSTADAPTQEQARALLDELREQIEPNIRAVGYVDGVSGRWVPGSDAWAPQEYDQIRRRIAEMIVRLL